MFSLDSVLDDLWPQARPAPRKKSVKRLFYEDEFQQFAAAHRHLKGLDMVEQVLEHGYSLHRFRPRSRTNPRTWPAGHHCQPPDGYTGRSGVAVRRLPRAARR